MTPDDRKWFRVEVIDHYGQIVAIEPGMLCGREINQMEEAKIREAIGHLQGFVGSGNPSEEFTADAESPSLETSPVPSACGEDVGFNMKCRRVRGHVGPHAHSPKMLFGEEPV